MTIILLCHLNKGVSFRGDAVGEAISTVHSEGLFLPSSSGIAMTIILIELYPTISSNISLPLRIHRINQLDLLFPRSGLDLFLARDGITYVCIKFKIHKFVNIIAPGETGYQLLLVLNSSLDESARNAGVQNSIVFIGKDIDGRFPLAFMITP